MAGEDLQTGGAAVNLPKAAQEAVAQLHAGMTRGEVERGFEMDGGLIFVPMFRYYVRDIRVGDQVVMVQRTFQPIGMPDVVFKDERQRIDWIRTHDSGWDAKDILRSIGSVSLSGAAID